MTEPESTLRSLHFERTLLVEGRTSIADLFRPNKRCGIYVLRFTNGEAYAGQAVDITRRYVQHRKTHDDIKHLDFKVAPRTALNAEERTVIQALERNGVRLRNITFTSVPAGVADFDLVMSTDEQDRWLQGLSHAEAPGVRTNDVALRARYLRKFDQFLKLPRAEQVVGILRNYVQRCIPAIRSSELSFWAVSCLPAFGVSGVTVYFRVNVNWQEVFTVARCDDSLDFSWHVAVSPLQRAFRETLQQLTDEHPGVEITQQCYTPGGQDQINLILHSPVGAVNLLEDDRIVAAMRLFNLRLMRKGPCVYSRYHCFSLADRLVNETS